VKLQKVMQNKVKELLDFDQESDSDSDSDNCPIIKRETPKKKGKGFIKGMCLQILIVYFVYIRVAMVAGIYLIFLAFAH